jgi:putative DNA primase/helicase
MSNDKCQESFLNMVRDGAGYLATKSPTEGWRQHWCRNNEEMVDCADQSWSTHDIYVSMATFSNRENTREAKFAETFRSFWVDIDQHKNSTYKTVEEIKVEMNRFLFETGLPAPNVLHYTGYGVHFYWAFDRPINREEWQPHAERLQTLLKTHNVAADPITADAARVLRLAGTQNFRYTSDPIETELKIVSKQPIPFDSFVSSLESAAERSPPAQTKSSRKSCSPVLPPTPENVELIKAMLALIDPDPFGPGGGNRARWMRLVWSVAATGWGATAYSIAKNWSQSGDLYNEADFNGVWDSYDPDWQVGEKKGIRFGTLVQHAKEAGYTGSLPKPLNQGPVLLPTLGKLITKPASDYHPQPVQYLVEGSVPLGAIAVIAGEPGVGKSQIAIRLAAAITTGQGLPDHKKFNDLGSVIILANEDDTERTIRPRLEAAAADLTKVHIVEGVTRKGSEVSFFQLDRDIAELQNTTAALGDVRLIIIDPPAAYLGPNVDTYKETDVRRVLAPIAKLAQDTGALVLLVVHLNKRSDASPQQRISGSTAWLAVPRVAFLACEDKATQNRYLVPVKNNLGDDKTGYQYQILERVIQCQDTQVRVSYVDWVAKTDMTANELLCSSQAKGGGAVDAAKQFLQEQLGGGPKSQKELEASAVAAGISMATVQRAKRNLRVESRRSGNGWQWALLS